MGLRYEVWTLPWDPAGFTRVIARLPVVEGSGRGSVSFQGSGGEGSADIDLSEFDRLDDVISDTVGRLVRVFDGTSVIDEWIPERVSRIHDDTTRIASISGPPLLSAFDKWVLYPFDYPANPSLDPDWIWGSSENLVVNGDFEGGLNFLDNEGFETGDVDPWFAGAVAGVSANIAIESTEVDTGSFSMRVTPLVLEGGASVIASDLHPRHDYTVSARIKAPAGATIQLGASGPSGIGLVTGDRRVEVAASPNGWEVQKDVVASGAWETIQLVFTSGPEQNSTQVSLRQSAGTLADFYVDVVTVSGQGVGMEGWEISPWNSNVLITASTEVTANTGSFTGKVTAGPEEGFFTSIGTVQKGAIYTITAWVRTLSGTARWTLDVINEYYNRLGQDSVVASTTWQKLEVSGIVPDAELPGDRELFVGFRNDSGGSSSAYFDTISVIRGRAATTVGDIVIQVMDDVSASRALKWVDYSSFSTTLDSSSNTWAGNVSVNLPFGLGYGQIWDELVNRGYEYELVPKASPTGTPPNHQTHDLKWYNPAGRDDLPSTGITVRQGVSGGSVIKRIPSYTSVVVEGREGVFVEDSDATAESNFGRTEKFLPARDTADSVSLGLIGDEALEFESENRTAIQFEVVAGPDWPRPLVDYRPGDTVPMQMPPTLQKESRRVQRIDYVNTDPTQYVVVGSRILPGEAGAWELVRRMWRRFQRRSDGSRLGAGAGASRPLPGYGGGVGAPTLVVASFYASDESKARADFVCDGSSDQNTIRAALDLLVTTGGRVLLTEGDFNFSARLTLDDTDDGVTIEGMGPTRSSNGGTRLLLGSSVNQDMIALIGPASGVRIANLLLDGNKANNTSGNGINTAGTSHAGLWIENVYALNIEDDSFRFSDSAQDVIMVGCISQNAGNQGYDINGGGVSLVNCIARSSGTEGFVLSGNNVTMIGCHAIASGGDGIWLQTTQDTTVVGCTSEQNSGDGIASGAASNGRCTITSNVIHNNGGWGILLGAATQNVVMGNVVTSNTSGAINNTDGSTHLIAHNIGGASADNAHAGLDTDAIHDNVAGEISAITEKTTPVSADLLLIEDSAASNAKKRVQIGNLPGGGGSSPNTTKGDLHGYDTGDARIPIGADGHVLTADSAQALGLKWAESSASSSTVSNPGTKFVVKATTESLTSNTTLQDDDELKFAIRPNEDWVLDAYLVTDGATGGDIKVAVKAPTGSSGTFAVEGPGTTATTFENATVNNQIVGVGPSPTGLPAGTLGAGNDTIVHVHAAIHNGSTAGDVVIQWAQNTSNGTATRVLADSYLIAQRTDATAQVLSGWSPILDHKPTTDTPDDEFDSTTLDAKWTAVTGSSGTVSLLETGEVQKYDLASRPGWLLMQAGSAANQKVELRQDFTLADGDSIQVAISLNSSSDGDMGIGADELWCGIALNDNDTGYDAGEYNALFLNVSTNIIRLLHYDGTTVFGSTSPFADKGISIPIGHVIYLRFARSGSTVYAFWSADGSSWMAMGSEARTATATNIWLFKESVAAASEPVPIVAVDWIRQGTNNLDPWPHSALIQLQSAEPLQNLLGHPSAPNMSTDTLWQGTDYTDDFTQVTVTGTQTVTEKNGLLSVKYSGQTSGDWNCALKAQTFSVGDTWLLPLRLFGLTPTTTGVNAAGIIFTDGTTSTSNMVNGVNLVSSGDPQGLMAGYHGTLTAGTTADWVADDSFAGWAWPQIFIRLQYSAANSFILDFSPDGVTFEDFGEATISKTMTPTHIGVCWQMSTTHPGDDIAIATFGSLTKVA